MEVEEKMVAAYLEYEGRFFEASRRRYEEVREEADSDKEIWGRLRDEMILKVEEAIEAMMAYGGPLGYSANQAGMREAEEEGWFIIDEARRLMGFMFGGFVAQELLEGLSQRERDQLKRRLERLDELESGRFKDVV